VNEFGVAEDGGLNKEEAFDGAGKLGAFAGMLGAVLNLQQAGEDGVFGATQSLREARVAAVQAADGG
jgi:hypothetical protein